MKRKTPRPRLTPETRFWTLYTKGKPKPDLNEFDWAFACYLAKRGDLSELVWMLCNDSSTYKPPPLRARKIIASLLQSRGVYRRRRRLTERDVDHVRAVYTLSVKRHPDIKKTWWYRRLAEQYNTGESTIRDIITRKRDFAGK